MNKKPSDKKPKVRKKADVISATSETVLQSTPKTELNKIVNFFTTLKCKNKKQKDFVTLIHEKDIVIANGPAGVGKSYIKVAKALELLKSKDNKFLKIIITKPAVESEEEHGFMPGTAREKMEPFIASTLDNFDKLIGKENRLKLEELEYLIVQPLAYIRGKSIDNSIIIIEEAQNTTPNQMKTILTRIGENSKLIISGDINQSDKFKYPNQSGLYDAMKKHKNIPEIGFIEFTEDEIVRHPFISKILANYKDEIKEPEQKVQKNIKVEKKQSIIQKLLNFFK